MLGRVSAEGCFMVLRWYLKIYPPEKGQKPWMAEEGSGSLLSYSSKPVCKGKKLHSEKKSTPSLITSSKPYLLRLPRWQRLFWGEHIQVVSMTEMAISLTLFSRDVVPLPLNRSYICAHISEHTDNLHQILIILTIILALRVYENFVWTNTVVCVCLV